MMPIKVRPLRNVMISSRSRSRSACTSGNFYLHRHGQFGAHKRTWAGISSPIKHLINNSRLLHDQPNNQWSRLHSSTTVNSVQASSSSQSNNDDTPEVEIPKKFVAHPFEYHQELTIRIDTLTNLGMGVARVNLADHIEKPDDSTTTSSDKDITKEEAPQWVIMVPNVIPGESVRVRIFRNHKQYSEADLVEVVEASPDRIEPQCPLAAECGGCQYQHMPITLQRQWKTKHVEECFRQQKVDLKGQPIEPTMGTDEVFHYRSKITPHYQAPAGVRARQRRRAREQEGKKGNKKPVKEVPDNNNGEPLPSVKVIGFQRSSVRSIIDVPYCPIATQPLNDEYQRTREEIINQPFHRTRGATLLFRQANVDDDTVVTDNNEYITTDVNGISFTYQAGNFFQNNLYILPKMVDIVMERASPPAPNGDAMTHFVDCYCGSGLFCLSAAKHFETCVGIEINRMAIEEAQRNAAKNNLSHKCAFEASRAEAIFDNPLVQTFPRDTTVVMLDPPRKGCDETFLKQLESFRPQRIVYLSCNPATQARDVKAMVSWGYDITFVQPFDLFPQTRHIESLTVLERH